MTKLAGDLLKNVLDEDETGGAFGGGSEEVAFRFHNTLSTQRDDSLPPTEKERILKVEQGLHKASVDKQKGLIQERKNQKEGIQLIQSYGRDGFGAGYGASSQFKTHPISEKFSGTRDKQVDNLPGKYEGQTNEKDQKKLEHHYQNKKEHKHQHTPQNSYIPKFTPR